MMRTLPEYENRFLTDTSIGRFHSIGNLCLTLAQPARRNLHFQKLVLAFVSRVMNFIVRSVLQLVQIVQFYATGAEF